MLLNMHQLIFCSEGKISRNRLPYGRRGDQLPGEYGFLDSIKSSILPKMRTLMLAGYDTTSGKFRINLS
jgi:hypothetical protein